jgi:transposase
MPETFVPFNKEGRMETTHERKKLEAGSEVKATFFGVDLHQDQITYHCSMRLANGENKHIRGVVSTNRISEDFIPMLEKDNCYVIVEAACSTFFFCGLVEGHCTRVIPINPIAFRELYSTGRKTDKIDAKKLANRLQYFIESGDKDDDFPIVTVPDAEAQMARKLVSSYEFLVKEITKIKNHIKAVFRAKIIDIADDALEGELEKVLEHPRLDRADRIMLESFKKMYDTVLAEKERMKKAILEIGARRFSKEVEILVSFTGISVMGAVVVMSDIISVDRFKSCKHMASYLASAGKVDASGNSTKNGGLNKRGRRTSYRFILQGLEHIVQGNEHLMRFKERHKAKKGNKVRGAMVRKTFVTMFYMLKNEETYRFVKKSLYDKKLKEIERILAKAA